MAVLGATPVELVSSSSVLTGTAASGSAVTITLPATAGRNHYITSLEIQQYAASALTGGATPTIVTTTNLPVAVTFNFDTALGVGVSQRLQLAPSAALKSLTAGVATTIVCPATSNVIWNVNVAFYTA